METLQKIHAKWRCLQDVCCRNGEGYVPLGYCDKALCKRRICVEIPKTKHCRDCKHYGYGYQQINQINKSHVCLAKPKKLKNNPENKSVHYVTLGNNIACDKFEPKTDKQ